MSNLKSIVKVIQPPSPHMVGDGFRVHNFFPNNPTIGLQGMSPFFLMDYASKHEFSATDKPRGVGVHPHRGFETVTLAYHGKVAHHDSAGNSGVIAEGDVQWMTAASGILHKEYHEKEWSKKGGLFQMVQLWVNLPAEYKMSPPKYQAIEREQMGKYSSTDGLYTIEIIAGNYREQKGPAHTFTPIEMYNIRSKPNATINFELPETYNTGLLVLDGEIIVNNQPAQCNQLLYFGHNGTNIEINSISECTLLLLSGEPINEPLYAFGPFLMNTKEEVIKAYQDLENGQFGFLED